MNSGSLRFGASVWLRYDYLVDDKLEQMRRVYFDYCFLLTAGLSEKEASGISEVTCQLGSAAAEGFLRDIAIANGNKDLSPETFSTASRCVFLAGLG